MLASITSVYRTPAFRSTISLVLLPHAVFFGIQGLWIGRWLSDVARFPDDAVAYLLYLGMAAVIFGAIAVGMITEWAGKRGVTPLDVAGAGIALFVLVQAAFVVGYKPSFQLLSVLFTLVGTVTGIEYAIVAQSMPRELTGRAATCLNLLIFVGAFLVQAGFGLVIGLWQPDARRALSGACLPGGLRGAGAAAAARTGRDMQGGVLQPAGPRQSPSRRRARPPERNVDCWTESSEANLSFSLQSGNYL